MVQKVGKLILDKLVSPLQTLITNDEELELFMAIILFDPCKSASASRSEVEIIMGEMGVCIA